jgi:hypothetical protein
MIVDHANRMGIMSIKRKGVAESLRTRCFERLRVQRQDEIKKRRISSVLTPNKVNQVERSVDSDILQNESGMRSLVAEEGRLQFLNS